MSPSFDPTSTTTSTTTSTIKVKGRAGGPGAEVSLVRYAARGQGVRQILLHGNPSRAEHWGVIAPQLGPGELVALDHPGFGESGALAPEAPTLRWSAEMVLGALDAAGLGGEPFEAVGHSHGGFVAVAMAALAPERVASLVLLSTGGTPAHFTYRLLPRRAVRAALGGVAAALGRSWGGGRAGELAIEASTRALFAPESPPAGYGRAEFAALRARPDVLGAMARLTLADPCAEVAEHAAHVRAPALFVHGRSDRVVPIAYARRLATLLEGAGAPVRFETLAGGHMLHVTQPERVGRSIADWRSLAFAREPVGERTPDGSRGQ
ncbi:MAG: alpha/beta hydrolase [Polyangiaceae bacterium]|nr:alpha/beta hydrolase [Polyangiaceae bacterium]